MCLWLFGVTRFETGAGRLDPVRGSADQPSVKTVTQIYKLPLLVGLFICFFMHSQLKCVMQYSAVLNEVVHTQTTAVLLRSTAVHLRFCLLTVFLTSGFTGKHFISL